MSQTISIDDFDSIIQYSANDAFNTPDPSNKTAVSAAQGSGYREGTYHETSVAGASWSLNFTGTKFTIYGTKGPSLGSFDISMDGQSSSHSAYASTNVSSVVLFEQSGLAAGPVHNVRMTNGNASIVFDWLSLDMDIGASGASVKNTTVEENSSSLIYTGTWGNNTSPFFSGGGSAYTNGDGASVSLNFTGSAIYAWGDVNANHGEYTVTLDLESPVTLKSVTGCGLPYQTQGVCERIAPGLLYARSYLSDGQHTVKIANVPGVNQTFFDLDRFEYSTPSKYFSSSSGTSTTAPSGSSTTASASATSTSQPSGANVSVVGVSMTNPVFVSLLLMWATILGLVRRR